MRGIALLCCSPRCSPVCGEAPQLQPTKPRLPTTPAPPCRSLELATADLQASVQLTALQLGRDMAIVVAAVAPGSAAAAAGCKPGQRLLAVSDPVRRGERWRLNGQSSLRYVRQAIRMRVADSIELQLTAQPIPEWRQAVEAARAAARAEAQPPQQPQAEEPPAPQPAAAEEEPQDLLSNIVRASMDASMDGGDAAAQDAALTAAGVAAAQKLTVAEKLEQRYREQAGQPPEGAARQQTDVERRRQRRKEYFEQVR